MKRLIWLVLVVLFLLPSVADAARYKIISTKGDTPFYLDSSRITTEKGERVSNTGVVVVYSEKFPVVWLMIPDVNDVIFLRAVMNDDKGPFKLFDKGGNIWGRLVKTP